jgi:hypothetical protein
LLIKGPALKPGFLFPFDVAAEAGFLNQVDRLIRK